MKKVFQSVAICMLGLYSSLSLASDNDSTNLLVGEWVSNKLETVNAMKQAGIPADEIERLSPLFGNLELSIQQSVYTTRINGRVTDLPYSIVSVSDNCYKIDIEQKIEELCVIDGMLHVPSYKGSKEVFRKKI